MKKILFVLSILVSVEAVGQLPSKGYFRYDSVYFEKIGGNAEFILRNSTRSVTNGVLTNLGNGRTAFVTPSATGTASNGITKVVNDFQLGGTLSAYTRIIGGNNVFEFTGMGYGSRFTATPRTGGTMGTMTFSNSNGTDSSFLNIQGRTAGASNREIHFGINHTASTALMELYFKNLVGTAPYAALTYSDPTRNTYVFVDSTRTYLSKQLSGSNRSTGLDLHNDSTSWYYGGSFAARTSEMLIRNGYQDSWATDSVRWRLGDRSASLTFNSDGWHAWQTLGEYYFYNVQRITDTTGLDILAWDRAESEMVRVPSDLVGGAGGGSSPPFADNAALVKNNADNTKLLILSAASIATGTTRTWTFPDVNGTVARNDAAQTFAGRQTFGAQAKFDAGFSVAGNYAANEGFMIGYDAGSNMATLIAYDGGYKDIRVISNVLTLYGGGSNPGVLINGSGNVVMGSTTAADATEKLVIIGNGKIINNSLTTGKTFDVSSSSVTSGAGVDVALTGTAAAGDGGFTTTQAGIRISLSGTNAITGVPTFGLNISNTHDGTGAINYGAYVNSTSGAENNGGYFSASANGSANIGLQGLASGTGAATNVGGKFSASGGTTNYALLSVAGNSGFNVATPTSALHTTSFATAYRALTALRTLDGTDHTIEVTANTFTVTLPTAVGITGRQYVITNSGAGTTTIATTSSQTFINVTSTPVTLTLNQFSTVTVVSNGANWLRTSSL